MWLLIHIDVNSLFSIFLETAILLVRPNFFQEATCFLIDLFYYLNLVSLSNLKIEIDSVNYISLYLEDAE